MAKNKGKPSGNDAESKTSVGRHGDYQRTGWPEDAPTQRVEDATDTQPGNPHGRELDFDDGEGRDRKAGSPV